MKNNNSTKTSLSIGGHMSEKGADKVGITLAHYVGIGVVIVSVAFLLWGIAQVIH
ncbi:hypothetical protein LJS80_002232 [Salmonella enterica]|nr:hypothetical protein [Salmonella enterica]EIK0388753.1 hypothetical protein [Salmonella enterica]